jgi:hypothetical protein
MAGSQKPTSKSSPKSTEPIARARIFRIKITLVGSDPPIWRSFEVPAEISLGALHTVIQTVMGWEFEHMHSFTIKKETYGSAHEEFGDEHDEEITALDKVARTRSKFEYEYDFGDCWIHGLEVEKVVAPEPGVFYPRCIAGERACPPEDCGGIYGYDQILEAVRDRENAPDSELLEWVGDDFDPAAFNVGEVNEALARRFAAKKGRVKERRGS